MRPGLLFLLLIGVAAADSQGGTTAAGKRGRIVRTATPVPPPPMPTPARVGGFAVPAGRVCVVGEEHVYRVDWGPVPLGVIRARTEALTAVDGSPAYHVKVWADSHPWLVFLYLHELFESWIDAEAVFCRKEIAHLAIGDERTTETYRFDCRHRKLRYTLEPVGKPYEAGDVDMVCPSQDLVSFVFLARALAYVPPPWEIVAPTLVHAEMKPTALRFDGVRETIRVGGRPRAALRMDGEARYETPEGFNGKFRIWIADDETRVPLRGQLKIVLGWITLDLVR